MKKVFFFLVGAFLFFFAAKKPAHADWVECPLYVTDPSDGVLSGSGSNKTLSSASHEFVGVKANCTPDSNGVKIQFQTSTPANIYFQNAYGSFAYHAFSGTNIDSYIDTNPNDLLSLTPTAPAGLIFGDPGVIPVTFSHFQIFYWVSSVTPSPTPSPMPSPSLAPSLSPVVSPSPSPLPTASPIIGSSATATLSLTPSTNSVTTGVPFTVNVEINGGGQTFNAAQSAVAVSPNLSVIGIQAPASNACNFQYTQAPTIADPSFAGAIVNASSLDCKVMALVLLPKGTGTGQVTFSNESVKSYVSSQEIFSLATNGSFTINNQPPQISGLMPKTFSFDAYPFDTYSTTVTLTGSKDSSVSHILFNDIESGVTYPTTNFWQAAVPTLSQGNNVLSFYGKDDAGNKTAVQNIVINRHILGDIDGDGAVDIGDVSLFAVDWGKKGNLTYPLSDLNGDGTVDLADFSILAKHEVSL